MQHRCALLERALQQLWGPWRPVLPRKEEEASMSVAEIYQRALDDER